MGVDVNENAIAAAIQTLASRVCLSKSRPSTPPRHPRMAEGNAAVAMADSDATFSHPQSDTRPMSSPDAPPRNTPTHKLTTNSPYRESNVHYACVFGALYSEMHVCVCSVTFAAVCNLPICFWIAVHCGGKLAHVTGQ